MVMWHVESTFYLEMMNHQNQKIGFITIPRLVLCYKWQPGILKENTELKSGLNRYPKTDLTHG